MLFNLYTLEILKTYKTERPVNSATISPLKDHVILGGGEDAMTVTQSSGKVGKFHAQFWHKVRGLFFCDLNRVISRVVLATCAFEHSGDTWGGMLTVTSVQIFQEEIGQVKGHFGPINTLAFHPSGKQYASGGEDGYVRIHNFDPSYFE